VPPVLELGHLLERLYLVAAVEEVGCAVRGALRTGVRIAVEHPDQALRLVEGKRLQQNGFDHAEDGRVRTDANGQREEDGQAEHFLLPEQLGTEL
jgi:hypothetical protein